MAGYEYEDETEKVTWSIVNDIKQVTEDIISSIIGSIQQVSFNKWASKFGAQSRLPIKMGHLHSYNIYHRSVWEEIIMCPMNWPLLP